MICYQMLQYYGAEEHCEAEWKLNSRQDKENTRNQLTHNSINKSVISVKKYGAVIVIEMNMV